MRFFSTLAFLLAVSATSFAQDPADIFHKTIDVDAINTIAFDVYADDQVEYREWPGDDILIETSVKINNGQKHVMDFFRKQGRWDLKPTVTGDQLTLASADTTRRKVEGTKGTSSETVVIVIYMPADFTGTDGRFTRISK